MKGHQVRDKYLKFFTSSPRNHKEISAAPLVVADDPSTLFTSAGMQPLVPYLMGEKHPEGKRVCNSQPSIRTQDIEEVGDTSHTTYFEMLGNWSFGDYFKKEQLPWVWEFLTEELGLPKERLWVTVFEGGDGVGRDDESVGIWKSLGVSEERIKFYGVKKNWWSRSGTPEMMPVGEIGGPTSEVFFEFTQVAHNPKYSKKCHPNCECGRFLEIGNSVFMVYKKTEKGLEELPNKNVDFGGGLERMTAAVNDDPDVFKIDVFKPIIERIENVSGKKYEGNEREMRVIADHVRAAEALAYEGVVPSNKLQGYVMRRLIRRAAVKMRKLKGSLVGPDLVDGGVIEEETERFMKTLEKGMKEVEKINEIDGKKAFDLYQTYGFPLEVTEEIFKERGQEIDRGRFEAEFEKHKELSRTASAGKFKGGLADHSEEVTALHTATHLLHAALREVLGKHVSQKGSNITSERLRFDFTHGEKMTDGEIKKVEELVNEQIDKDLIVTMEMMSLGEAKSSGALAFFGDRYDEKVKVYSIGDFSKEVCGGPHVSKLSEMGGHVKIKKEEAVSSGVRRIYAYIE